MLLARVADALAAREINIGTTLASHGYVCMSINYALAKSTTTAHWDQGSARASSHRHMA